MDEEKKDNSNRLALSLHCGQGRVSVASGVVDGIPSIVIELLEKPLPVGTEVPQEAETVGFPIVVHFHSIEGLNVWQRRLNEVEKLLKEA